MQCRQSTYVGNIELNQTFQFLQVMQMWATNDVPIEAYFITQLLEKLTKGVMDLFFAFYPYLQSSIPHKKVKSRVI